MWHGAAVVSAVAGLIFGPFCVQFPSCPTLQKHACVASHGNSKFIQFIHRCVYEAVANWLIQMYPLAGIENERMDVQLNQDIRNRNDFRWQTFFSF